MINGGGGTEFSRHLQILHEELELTKDGFVSRALDHLDALDEVSHLISSNRQCICFCSCFCVYDLTDRALPSSQEASDVLRAQIGKFL